MSKRITVPASAVAEPPKPWSRDGLPSDDDKCGSEWEDDETGTGHECRLPKGHLDDHICMYQDDDQDWCRWDNFDTPHAG